MHIGNGRRPQFAHHCFTGTAAEQRTAVLTLCVHFPSRCLLILHYATLLIDLPKKYRLAAKLITG
jgi:hypothetical protein